MNSIFFWSFRHRGPQLALGLAATLFCQVSTSLAQPPVATVSTLVLDGSPTGATHEGLACLQRFPELSEINRLQIGDTLRAGDVLKAGPCLGPPPEDSIGLGSPSRLLIELTCEDGHSRMILSGNFKVLAHSADLEQDGSEPSPWLDACVMHLPIGAVDVVTSGKTRVETGTGIALGSESTIYSVISNCSSCEDDVTCYVFEGSVKAEVTKGRVGTQIIDAGRFWTSRSPANTERIESHDPYVNQAINRLTRIDLARASAQGRSQPFEQDLFYSYKEMFLNLEDSSARERWLRFQQDLGLIQTWPSVPKPNTVPNPNVELAGGCEPPFAEVAGVARCPPPKVAPPEPSQARLATEKGWARVDLPPNLRVGEVVSGQIRVAVAGLPEKREKYREQLSHYQIQVGDQRFPFQEGSFTVELPNAGQLPLKLLNRRGKSKADAFILLDQGERTKVEQFIAPPFCASGKAFHIAGPFDGQLSNTHLHINSEPLAILQESSQGLVAACPQTLGAGQLELREGSTFRIPQFHVLGFEFNIAQDALTKGNTTTATVRISGLENFDHPLGLWVHNSDPTSVRIDGEPEGQLLRFSPEAWIHGSIERTFSLTAKKVGSSTFRPELVAFQWLVMN